LTSVKNLGEPKIKEKLFEEKKIKLKRGKNKGKGTFNGFFLQEWNLDDDESSKRRDQRDSERNGYTGG